MEKSMCYKIDFALNQVRASLWSETLIRLTVLILTKRYSLPPPDRAAKLKEQG